MTMSIGTIAQKALRRLGVRVVPLDDSPTLTEMVPFDVIATMALVELGVIASDETPSDTDQVQPMLPTRWPPSTPLWTPRASFGGR